jgi:glutamate-1-semialdehyde 2,1-aminomutase
MAQAKARLTGGAERPRNRPVRPAAPDYAAVLRGAQARDGAEVRDADGHALLDVVNDQGAVLLGWNDREVEAAVRAGRDPARLETEAAERLAALIPSAEAVGFRASFEAALADALMAAKTLTGRDGAIFCDGTAATGDAAALASALDQSAGETAAVVIRPLQAPRDFLVEAQKLARAYGAVLIFDERRSAFRVHRGGVQALTGVFPDATLIGAAIANGRPMAAIAGALEPMRAMQGFGAHISAAALAAACVTLDRVERVDSAQVLRVIGAEISAEVEARLVGAGAEGWLQIGGDPAWSVVSAPPRPGGDAAALEAALAADLYEHGVLSLGAHIPSLAFGGREVGRLLAAYDAVLPGLALRTQGGAFNRRAERRA